MIAILLLAASFQNTATLDRAVANFTGSAIGDEGGARAAVDGRLRLASCPTVALSWRSEAKDAVVVTCAGPDWRIFVPVRRVAPVTTSPAAPVTGSAAPVVAAKVAPVIKRGDPVLIEAGSGGFQITREGIAAADAAPGARLPVRVEGAVQPVQAVAVAHGRVALPGL
jgi:flagella basal body P-ring formation protein FlgA